MLDNREKAILTELLLGRRGVFVICHCWWKWGWKKYGAEIDFVSVEEYEKYLRSKQLYKEGAKKIVVTGQMADATGLIDTLERVGYNVYPVLSLRRLLDFVREISPDAIINMAHGRLGDEVVKYLRNVISCFLPINQVIFIMIICT